MSRKKRTAQPEERLGKLAAKQHGVVSRKQMRHLGMSDDAIDHAVKIGRLQRVFRGVYAVGHPRRDERSRLMAAALACGNGAVISHRSAGAFLGLLDKGPVVIDVIAPPSRGRKIDGIRFHHVRAPRLEETGTFDRIPARARRGRWSTSRASSVNGRCAAPSSERRGSKCLTSLRSKPLSTRAAVG
ncbi:MAG TPA: type IV toxin-antitoxin system AbiEi family antitoxin domain-containing protein [Solirubrobacterales bacterium]|nr:type IV toxin-antitoxin system AbiEi family antitoxin domain-containing protein [Solirubrobacterales bacterium]